MGDALVRTSDLALSLLGSVDLPLIEAVLAPGAKLCAEPGRMISLPVGVELRAILGDGSEVGMLAKLSTAGSRFLSGESFMLAEFKNTTSVPQTLRFGTTTPGNVVPLQLSDFGGEIIGMSGAYLLGSSGLKVASCFKQKLGAAFFGGESFILQKISGDGIVLLQGSGAVLREELTTERPSLRIDTGCLVAFTRDLVYSVALAGGLKSMMFAGEGVFHATISLAPGQTKGTVWIESFPFNRYIDQIKGMYKH